jgi:apolipoprotein N-acyltransferase
MLPALNRPCAPWTRFLAAAATGGLWALSFPSWNIAGLAWAVPGLLLMLTGGLDRGLAFRTAYVAGATHYLVSLSWLRHIPFPVGAYTGWFALSFFLALFPTAWVLVCWALGRTVGIKVAPAAVSRSNVCDKSTVRGKKHPGSNSHSAGSPDHAAGVASGLVVFLSTLGDAFAAVPLGRLVAWFALCAAAWVSWEMVLARIFGGFPWNLLGTSQFRLIPLIQVASATGVYGVSFLVAWFSIALVGATVVLVNHPRGRRWRLAIAIPAATTVAVIAWGFLILRMDRPAPRSLSVALVQPSIPQTMIFDPTTGTNRFETLLGLTVEALKLKPEVLLWPEASLPGGLKEADFDRLITALRESGAWMVFGADEVTASQSAEGEEHLRSYNSAFLLNPKGKVVAGYRKRRLVIFGEYIPFGRWLPVLQHLAPIGAGFQAGTAPVPFHMESLDATTSVLICFEDNFPHQAREHAQPQTDFLLNLTNDGWFGESAAQWQHLANAVFRSVENGIPLVRCANNGISCWVDERGRIHSGRLKNGRDVYEAGFEIVTVRFGSEPRTVYRRTGDLFGWGCVAVTTFMLAGAPLRSRLSRRGK